MSKYSAMDINFYLALQLYKYIFVHNLINIQELRLPRRHNQRVWTLQLRKWKTPNSI